MDGETVAVAAGMIGIMLMAFFGLAVVCEEFFVPALVRLAQILFRQIPACILCATITQGIIKRGALG